MSRNRSSGSKRKHQCDGSCQEGGSLSLNEQLINVLNTQNSLLRSIDARLGRIERHGQPLGGRHGQGRSSSLALDAQSAVNGSWKFLESSGGASQRQNQKDSNRIAGRGRSVVVSVLGKVEEDGQVLLGEPYRTSSSLSETHSSGHYGNFDNCNTGSIPSWTGNTRHLLTQIAFNEKAELMHKSGIFVSCQIQLQYAFISSPEPRCCYHYRRDRVS